MLLGRIRLLGLLMALPAEQPRVRIGVPLDCIEPMQLRTTRRKRLGTLITKVALELALQVLQPAALRRRAALVKLQPLENVAAKLKTKIGIISRGGFNLRTRLVEDLDRLLPVFVAECRHAVRQNTVYAGRLCKENAALLYTNEFVVKFLYTNRNM